MIKFRKPNLEGAWIPVQNMLWVRGRSSQADTTVKELMMPNAKYPDFRALDPFFEVVQQGLSEFVDGDHYSDTIADDALFEFLYHFLGWPKTIQGRANLMAAYSAYGKNIVLHLGDEPSKSLGIRCYRWLTGRGYI